MYCGASVSYMYLTKRTEDETLSMSPISLVRYHHLLLERKKIPFGEIFLTTFLSTVEVAALSYERREKEGGEKEEEGETKGGKKEGELRDRYVDQISSVSAHNNCGFYLFAKGRKRKKKGIW